VLPLRELMLRISKEKRSFQILKKVYTQCNHVEVIMEEAKEVTSSSLALKEEKLPPNIIKKMELLKINYDSEPKVTSRPQEKGFRYTCI
jgi:hypothetical protein